MKRTLDRFEEKLHVLHDWVHDDRAHLYGIEHRFVTMGALTEQMLVGLEQNVGAPLPPEYRAFLLRFGDGKVGPGWFQPVGDAKTPTSGYKFPLSQPFLGCVSPTHHALSEKDQPEDYARLSQEWGTIPRDDGILRICNYGCAIYGHLILNGPFAGHVWVISGDAAYYGPFGGSEGLHDEGAGMDWEPTLTPRDYSFFEWYENWLDGQLSFAGLLD